MPALLNEEELARQRAFETVFARFDPKSTGTINSKVFLDFIDELDAIQPEDAAPIMTEVQRTSAQDVVDAGLTMTKVEVLGFLQDIGVEIRLPSDAGTRSPEAQSEAEFDATSPLINARPRSAALPNRPRPLHRISRSISSQAASQSFDNGANMNTFEHSRLEDLSRAQGTSTPLAQSTPHKNAGKENRRPLTSHKSSSKAVFSAVGEGAFSPSSSTRAREDEFPFGEEEMIHLRDQVKMLQERERLSERTIATNEEQIHRLEALLSENRAEMARNNRTLTELRADCKTAEKDIAMLEGNVEDAHVQMKQLQEKHDRVKVDLDAQIADTASSRAALKDRNEKIEDLEADLQALESDRKLIQTEKTSLLSQIGALEAQRIELREAESKLSDAMARCDELESETQRLRHDLDQAKQASMRKARDDLRALEAHKEIKPDAAQKEVRMEQLRRATEWKLTSKSTQTQEMYDDGDTTRLRDDAALEQEEAMKERYARFSSELGLQKNLIEQMMKMKPGLKKFKSKSIKASATPSLDAMTDGKESLLVIPRRQWVMLAPLIVLYSLVLLFLGYMIATQQSAVNAPGVSYAELRSWERANALDYIMDHHGVLGRRPFHWYEGRWRWIEMAGYWIQEALQDRPWPS